METAAEEITTEEVKQRQSEAALVSLETEYSRLVKEAEEANAKHARIVAVCGGQKSRRVGLASVVFFLCVRVRECFGGEGACRRDHPNFRPLSQSTACPA